MTAERTGPRVVIASDQVLVAQTVGSALRERGFEVVVVGLDDRRGTDGADVGLLISELSTRDQVGSARAIIGAHGLRWAVVAPRGPCWGALLAAGAAVVLDSSASLDDVIEVLESLADQTFVADRDAERDLLREWERTCAES